MSTTDPQKFARQVLDDIEVVLAEAYTAVDEWDRDRLARAFADIAAHVKAWERGPVTDQSSGGRE